jgi:DNA modification methylase
MTAYPMTSTVEWRNFVTPKLLRESPIHRWLVFPHSFTNELVDDLISKWGLGREDRILDPFLGAGTTLLAAQKAGIKSTGYDLSPFAVFVSKVKTTLHDYGKLCANWERINKSFIKLRGNKARKDYPELVLKAFSPEILLAFEKMRATIMSLASDESSQDFFLLALLAIIPSMSRAEAAGGWLKWIEKEHSVEEFTEALNLQVSMMLMDVRSDTRVKEVEAVSVINDARYLPEAEPCYSAIITSPPYPNRHDYTRVFGVELMFGFLDWDQTRALRYQSLHSHPEAKPQRPSVQGYQPPDTLKASMDKVRKTAPKRIQRMLEGYFLDLFCCFREMKKVGHKHANIAVVLGNAQYYGESFLVDELAANIGEQAGLTCKEIITARIRGNSAQQMKKYGRNPSRESVILFNA